MNNPLGVNPSKGKQGTTRGKEKIFWPRWESVGIEPTIWLGSIPTKVKRFFRLLYPVQVK